MSWRFVAEPFLSRRLGVSVGIDVLEFPKKCTMNCVYCEIGETAPSQLKSSSFRYETRPDPRQFEEELRDVLRRNPGVDCLTFGYYGEPTLAVNLEFYLDLAQTIKKDYEHADGRPYLTIFTNSTTITQPEIRHVLTKFDQIIAKLDCATQELYGVVNQVLESEPQIHEIIEGLRIFQDSILNSPNKQLILQTLLFRSDNPKCPSNLTETNLNALAVAYNTIQPAFIQLYGISRAPAMGGIHPLTITDKNYIRVYFSTRIDKKIGWKVF